MNVSSISTPIDNILIATYLYRKKVVGAKTWKEQSLEEPIELPYSIIDESGVQARPSTPQQDSLDSDAILYTKVDMYFNRGDVIIDRDRKRQYSVRGFTAESHPGTTTFWVSKVFLSYVGDWNG